MSAGAAGRAGVLDEVAEAVRALSRRERRRVGVDGVDGAGKTRFADDLATALRASGEVVVRASVDGFHHAASVRYRRGRSSPDGYYLDSYDLSAVHRHLLDPLGPGGSGKYVAAVHDVARERPVHEPVRTAPPEAVLIVDGIFLHRPELRGVWDLSVFLDAPFAATVARCAARDGTDPDPASPRNRRYVEGQRRYLRECDPAARASYVVDATDLDDLRAVPG